MQAIIVGIDRSLCSDAALEFAAEETSLRNAKLLAVAFWEGGPSPVGSFPTVDLIHRYRSAVSRDVSNPT